ncbi:MAG: hypothetical protein Q9168_005264 [Polycauliona sp. 1 TL-2023]
MARLEDLPQELIEMIFFESLNLSLPRASPRLGRLLSTPKTKNDLVMLAFPSTMIYNSYHCARYDDDDSYYEMAHFDELSHKLWAGDSDSTSSAIGRLHSNILSCRWMTWDFLKQYFETATVRAFLRGFREQNLAWLDGQRINETIVHEYIHNEVYRNLQVEYPETRYKQGLDHDPPVLREEWDRWYRGAEEFSGWERDTSPKAGQTTLGLVPRKGQTRDKQEARMFTTYALAARSWKLEDGVQRPAWDLDPQASLVVGRRTGLVHFGYLRQCKCEKKGWHFWSGGFKCLNCRYGPCPIPAKLLTGPWTDEKLHFLEAVLEGGATITSAEQENLAHRGLMDAIKEDDYRAIDLLAVIGRDEQYLDPHRMEGQYVEPSMAYAEFDLGALDEDASAFVKTHWLERRTCGVRPTTDHLKTAVIEKGCRKMIVRRLLFANKADIDRQDSSITTWMMESQLISGNSKAAWLQYQLKSSAKVQSEVGYLQYQNGISEDADDDGGNDGWTMSTRDMRPSENYGPTFLKLP